MQRKVAKLGNNFYYKYLVSIHKTPPSLQYVGTNHLDEHGRSEL